MKLLGFCNLFVRKVNKDGKIYIFPELSVSSKDEDGKFKNVTLKANFKKDLVETSELEENVCYGIEITDSIVNIEYDEYKKCNILKVTILDLEFKAETALSNKKPVSKKKSPK